MSAVPVLSAARRERGAHVGPALPARTMAGFVVAIVAVVLIAAMSYLSLQSRASTAELVTHTVEVMEQLQALLSTVKDAETGQRGYLLTGSDAYLEPYTAARAGLPGRLGAMRRLVADSPVQTQRLDEIEKIAADKMNELAETVTLKRAGNIAGAMAVVASDRGKASMDRIRTLVGNMDRDERALLDRRQEEWRDASALSNRVTWIGSAVLLILIGVAATMSSRDHRARQTQVWLRTGQARMAEHMQGDLRLDTLGANALAFLADYLDARVGALYVADDGGPYKRIATYAVTEGSGAALLRPGDGLLGETARSQRALHVTDVPAGYLPVSSSLGRADPRELLLAPAVIDGDVQAVVELGFLRRVTAADRELLDRLSESLGAAVRSAKDRSRLEELLEETQRQAEELQTQQEELRVNNEELEEQGRVLKESQAQMEVQQAELEQTNSQLEEQTQLLEHQKQDLALSQQLVSAKADELEKTNLYKSEFLANMSHELRTPLNSTLILAKLLADNKAGNLTDEQVKFAQTIGAAGNDLLALINDVLDLSKIEAGKVDVNVEEVTVARAVDALVKTMQPIAVQKGIVLRAEIDAGTPQTITTDTQRLAQILKNLLSNALKFTDKGEVALRVHVAEEGALAFAVRDTGIGIAPSQQGLIFEAFRQADGSTHRKYGGTGLGLSISRDLAQLLGGRIDVQSEPGQGSVFTLTLPVAHQAATAILAEAPVPAATPAAASAPLVAAPPVSAHPAVRPAAIEDDRDRLAPGDRLILVIEDDLRFAAILRDMVQEVSFRCIVAATASDGLVAASTYRPSAILLDIHLPDHSGLVVLDQLKHNPMTRHIPVHVLSVADYTREALELGAVGYDLKPVKRAQILEALERLEAKFSQRLRRVLVVEDDERQRESIRHLLGNADVHIDAVDTAKGALEQLKGNAYDCMIMDLNLPDLSGYELLEAMAEGDDSYPPVIVYTGRSLAPDEEQQLRRFSKSIIIKDARSPERLLDEVTLFLHQVESTLPAEMQQMLKTARDRDASLDGRRILVVEDDVRNVFALTSLLEPKGAKVELARNGKEALRALADSSGVPEKAIDLVLMDIMMPEMDGLTAMREIRKQAEWKRLPIIAMTAKAMRDDQEKCLAAGANDYIAKPLDVEKLLSLVRVWMPK
jgi:signal transduction histidine kinase/DNA-binding response OmpR family regulator/CHASE3 domain sensor protein